MSTKTHPLTPRPHKSNQKPWIEWSKFTPFGGEMKSFRANTAAIRSGTYWTFAKIRGFTQEEANACGFPCVAPEVPHPYLTVFTQSSPASLFSSLRKMGTRDSSCFDHTREKIARVELTRNGFNVTFFDTYRVPPASVL